MKKGFSLIELIVVIGILAVLGLLVTPKILGMVDSAKEEVAKNNLRQCLISITEANHAMANKLPNAEEAFAAIDPLCTINGNRKDNYKQSLEYNINTFNIPKRVNYSWAPAVKFTTLWQVQYNIFDNNGQYGAYYLARDFNNVEIMIYKNY